MNLVSSRLGCLLFPVNRKLSGAGIYLREVSSLRVDCKVLFHYALIASLSCDSQGRLANIFVGSVGNCIIRSLFQRLIAKLDGDVLCLIIPRYQRMRTSAFGAAEPPFSSS